MLKIISGKLKNSKIFFNKDIKPTKEIVKKSLFDLIGKKIFRSNCLDLFAGSGSLGFEAISRGANKIFFNDISLKNIKKIKKNCFRFGINNCSFFNFHYKDFFNKNKNLFDIIFIDPPYRIYNRKMLDYSLKILKKGGLIYLENNYNINFKNIKKIGKNGNVYYYLICS
ncbi:RsmD family RNA methyltransferase [Candidatus Vidania fulgoroideorum]